MQVINGEDMIFGRLASQIAKRLVRGDDVHLINAEKLVIMGNPKQITQRYLTKRGLRNKGTPERSPVWPKLPHLLVKRMIRGMLPMKSSRGKVALGRLRVHTGNPKRIDVNTKIENATYDGVSKHVTIYEICKSIGYSG